MASLEILIKTLGMNNVKNMNNDLAGTVSSLTGINLASFTAAGALGLFAAGAKKAVAETMDYAAQVRELSRITGDGAENTSRLIQVADDLAISENELSTAMEGATRKGIDVSIDGLKRLSDQYLALEPGLERSKFLMDAFGRSGTSMAQMMEQGSSGIDQMAASIASNMILTKENVDQAREMEIAMDDLGDAVQGVGYSIGKGLIPPLKDAANGLNTLLSWSDKVKSAHQQQADAVLLSSGSYHEYAQAVLDAYVRTGEMGTRQQEMIMADIDAGKWSEILAEKYNLQSESVFGLQQRLQNIIPVEDRWSLAAQAATNAVELKAQADSEAAARQREMESAIRASNTALLGQWDVIEQLSGKGVKEKDFLNIGGESLKDLLKDGKISGETFNAAFAPVAETLGIASEKGLLLAEGLEVISKLTSSGQIVGPEFQGAMNAVFKDSADGVLSLTDSLAPFAEIGDIIAASAGDMTTYADSSKSVGQNLSDLSLNTKPQMDKMSIDLQNAYLAMDKGFYTPTNKKLSEADENLKSIASRAASLKTWADANTIIIRVEIQTTGSFPSVGGYSSSSRTEQGSGTARHNAWTGGFAEANDVILVGENGPELFVPPNSGRIMNNGDSSKALSSGGGGTVIFNFKDTTLNMQELSNAWRQLQDMAGGYA